MKHSGKKGKRSGPVGYRTASSFLHRKTKHTKQIKAQARRQNLKKGY